MENWHLNFPQLTSSKTRATHTCSRIANTSVVLSDEFMKRVEKDEDWYLFDPAETADLIELYGSAFSKRYKEYVKLAEAGKLRV